MLTDPATLLRDHIASQAITSTIIISISTDPASPLFGGGTDNIAFNATASAPNAQALKMEATFWIETVDFTVEVPTWPHVSVATPVPNAPIPIPPSTFA